MRKLTFLEALRGYAILGVIFTHSTSKMIDLPQWLYNFGIQGSRGVQLFFIVSAFTLFYSITYSKTNKLELESFYIKRFFRIAPMFYFSFVFYTMYDLATYMLGVKPTVNIYSIEMIASSLTFVSVLHPDWLYSLVPGGWSISSEFLFYLCIPFLFKVIKNTYQALLTFFVTLILGISLSFFMKQLNIVDNNSDYLFYWFPNQLFIFLLGIVLFFYWKTNKIVSKRINNFIISLSFLCLVVLSFTSFEINSLFPKHLLFGISFCLFAYGLSNSNNFLLNNKIIQWIGKVSFSVYLVHFFVLDVVYYVYSRFFNFGFPSELILIMIFFTTLGFSLLISYVTYQYVEVPGIKYGKYLINRLSYRNQNKVA